MKTVGLIWIALITLGSAHAEDTWQKDKDCAAQTEKFRAEYRAKFGVGVDDSVRNYIESSTRHHYSPRYGHCYFQVDTTYYPKATATHAFESSTSLYDPFEGDIGLAGIRTDGAGRSTGAVGSDVVMTAEGYRAAAAFIADRMSY